MLSVQIAESFVARVHSTAIVAALALTVAACGSSAATVDAAISDGHAIDGISRSDGAMADAARSDAAHSDDAQRSDDAARPVDAAVVIDATGTIDAMPPPPSAVITSSLEGGFGFSTGDGSANSPFTVSLNSSASIIIAYTNNGPVDAVNFATSLAVPEGWSFQTGDCDGFTLSANGANSCAMGYAIDTSTLGESDFDTDDDIVASWSEAAASYSNISVTGVDTVFASVVTPPPVITVSTTGLDDNGAVVQGGSFTITMTLTNGDGVTDQTINFDGITPSDPNFALAPPNCIVNANSPSCSLSAGIGANVAVTSYAALVSNANSVALRGGTIDFNVITAPAKRIFVTAASHDGNLGGFAGANALCNNDSNRPVDSTTFKAMLFGNNPTKSGTSYFQPDEVTEIGTASGSFLEQFLGNVIADNGDSAWTGSDNNNCNGWTDNDGGVSGTIGLANATDDSWFDLTDESCSSTLIHLYCVEQ